jgi:hypothetical protein
VEFRTFQGRLLAVGLVTLAWILVGPHLFSLPRTYLWLVTVGFFAYAIVIVYLMVLLLEAMAEAPWNTRVPQSIGPRP